MPKISIIIPVYNVEAFLPRCIESVLNQTDRDFELLLIDDGSMDSSLSICNHYSQLDIRVKVFHHSNSGVSFSRNVGLEKATGEWVTFIDSDDWVDESFLKDFQIVNNSGADIIVQGLKYIDHNTGLEKRRRVFRDDIITAPDADGKFEEYDILSFGVTVCKCYKKNIITNASLTFCEAISYHEDHIFTLDFISNSNTIVTTSACGYNYRCGHNPQSLSKKRHTWTSQAMAARRMMDELSRIRQRFKISPSYFNRIATFCLSPKVNAVINLFSEKMPFWVTRSEMIRIFDPKKEFALYYYPDDKRYGMVRFFVKDPTWMLLYLFFKILSFRRR